MNPAEKDIEALIREKGKNFPRITPADVENAIVREMYFTASDGVCGAQWKEHGTEFQAHAPLESELLTFCVLILRNGYTVHGVSACAHPGNFDAEIGRKIARENAINEIWPLLGYALRDKLSG